MPEATSTESRHAGLHRRVLQQVDDLLALAQSRDPVIAAVTPVSGWSILHHVEHLSLAGEGSLHQLEAALERDGGPPIRLTGRVLQLVGWIPRGAGKAPELTRPALEEREAVVARLEAVRRRVEQLGARLDRIGSARGRSSHPIFGGFTALQWLRFLSIHHHHHLKIVDEILRAAEADRAP